MLVFYVMGSRSGGQTPGAILAYGLPEVLPEPEIINVIREVEVQVEVIREVPIEVIREVTVEVIREVAISPISYVVIGVGVVLVVVAGILFSRRVI